MGLLPFLSAECKPHSQEGQETQVCAALTSGTVARTLVGCCRHPQKTVSSGASAELVKNREQQANQENIKTFCYFLEYLKHISYLQEHCLTPHFLVRTLQMASPRKKVSLETWIKEFEKCNIFYGLFFVLFCLFSARWRGRRGDTQYLSAY